MSSGSGGDHNEIIIIFSFIFKFILAQVGAKPAGVILMSRSSKRVHADKGITPLMNW